MIRHGRDVGAIPLFRDSSRPRRGRDSSIQGANCFVFAMSFLSPFVVCISPDDFFVTWASPDDLFVKSSAAMIKRRDENNTHNYNVTVEPPKFHLIGWEWQYVISQSPDKTNQTVWWHLIWIHVTGDSATFENGDDNTLIYSFAYTAHAVWHLIIHQNVIYIKKEQHLYINLDMHDT